MPSQQDIDYGKLGAKYGKRGGRPSSKGELPGMATVECDEIAAFLNSHDFWHFSSTENFQFFSKKRPLLEGGFVENMFFYKVSYIFLVLKVEETL